MRCPTCNAPAPQYFPATGYEGEVSYFCPDLYHDSDLWHLARRDKNVQALIDEARIRSARAALARVQPEVTE